jgi:hypothetical protein
MKIKCIQTYDNYKFYIEELYVKEIDCFDIYIFNFHYKLTFIILIEIAQIVIYFHNIGWYNGWYG